MPSNWSKIRDEWLDRTAVAKDDAKWALDCLLYTSPSPRDGCRSRMPSSA